MIEASLYALAALVGMIAVVSAWFRWIDFCFERLPERWSEVAAFAPLGAVIYVVLWLTFAGVIE